VELELAYGNLFTKFNFEIFNKIGNFKTVDGKLGAINKIGIYMSGGLDSAALLALILSELKYIDKLESIPVFCFTVTKHNVPTNYAARLVKKVEEHFNVSLTHINDIPNSPHDAYLNGYLGENAIKYIKNYTPNMIVYMGINKMAPDDIRPFKQTLKIEYGNSKYNSYYSSPFLFLHKPQIIDILYKLNCEDLIPYTQSCNTLQVGKCGECYACAERKWGFDYLEKSDPDTILP